jgi:adenylosuccinate lyase
MVQEHERDGRGWKAEWVAFPEACLLSGAALSMAAGLVEGLTVDAGRMRLNLEAGGGYAASEQLLAVLAQRLGKHEAQRMLQERLQVATRRGQPFKEVLTDDSELGRELRETVLPDLFQEPDTGCAGAMVDAVIACARQARAEEGDEWPSPAFR